jgi:hypothetical protein
MAAVWCRAAHVPGRRLCDHVCDAHGSHTAAEIQVSVGPVVVGVGPVVVRVGPIVVRVGPVVVRVGPVVVGVGFATMSVTLMAATLLQRFK